MKTAPRYHSPLREEQSAATRERILTACAAVMETGAELTYRAVAAEAGVQERTVYRHFPTKDHLERGLWQWILDHLTHVDFSPKNTEQLVGNMRASFAGFDAGAPLIQAMLHSPQGTRVRAGQQSERRAMFEACVADAVPGLPPEVQARAAAAVQVLYSASAWELLRVFWGMDAGQAADVIELAIRSLLIGLRSSYAAEK